MMRFLSQGKSSNNNNTTENKGLLFGMQDDEEEEKYRQLQLMRHKNGSINSPSLKQLVSTSIDGRSVLKSEILESNIRLLQIKHGMAIQEIINKP